MNYKPIDQHSILMKMTFEDLKHYHLTLEDFEENHEKIQMAFFKIFDDQGLTNYFSPDAVLSFAVKSGTSGMEIIIKEVPDGAEKLSSMDQFFKDFMGLTPDDLEDLRDVKERFKSAKHKKQEIPDFVYYALEFLSMTDAIRLAKSVNYEPQDSELYSYQGHYFLVILDSPKENGNEWVTTMRTRLSEFALDSSVSRANLMEYGDAIIYHKALDVLKTL